MSVPYDVLKLLKLTDEQMACIEKEAKRNPIPIVGGSGRGLPADLGASLDSILNQSAGGPNRFSSDPSNRASALLAGKRAPLSKSSDALSTAAGPATPARAGKENKREASEGDDELVRRSGMKKARSSDALGGRMFNNPFDPRAESFASVVSQAASEAGSALPGAPGSAPRRELYAWGSAENGGTAAPAPTPAAEPEAPAPRARPAFARTAAKAVPAIAGPPRLAFKPRASFSKMGAPRQASITLPQTPAFATEPVRRGGPC